MSWSGRRRPLSATHQLSAFCMVLLWCAAPILTVLHANAEVHRYCAEHRAVEEAGPAGQQTAQPAPGERASGASEGAATHGGCAFSRFCRFGQSLAPFIFGTTGDLEISAIQAPVLLELPARIAVIRIAPKTSPPV